MAVLQSTNVQGALCVNGVAVGGGKDVYFCCITASTTWTPPSDLVTGDGLVDTVIVAGGGGGGMICLTENFYRICAAAGGGGGGEVRTFPCRMTSSNDVCTITVGAGGNSGSNGASCTVIPCAGGQGGDTVVFGITAYGGGSGGSSQWSKTNNTCNKYSCFYDLTGGPWGARASAPSTVDAVALQDRNPANGGVIGQGGSSQDSRLSPYYGVTPAPPTSSWIVNGTYFQAATGYSNQANTKKAEGYQHGTDFFSPGGTSQCIMMAPGRHSYGEFSAGCGTTGYRDYFCSGSSVHCGAGGGAGSLLGYGGTGGDECMRGTAGNDGVVVLKWQQ